MTGTASRQLLPLRIYDDPAGAVIAAPCGAEAGVVDLAPGRSYRGASDQTASGLLRMARHVLGCQECQHAAVPGTPAGRPHLLPLRACGDAREVVIAAPCGTEAAVQAPSLTDRWKGMSGPSAIGLPRMVLHARGCRKCRNLAVAQPQFSRSR